METKSVVYQERYQLFFTDMLNQRIIGGQYQSVAVAILVGRGIVAGGRRSTFKVIRMSDGVTLAQSKAAQS